MLWFSNTMNSTSTDLSRKVLSKISFGIFFLILWLYMADCHGNNVMVMNEDICGKKIKVLEPRLYVS